MTINPENTLELKGRIASPINEYSKDKAANINIAVVSPKGGTDFIQLKSFVPATYNILKKGMRVHIYGHIGTSSYEKFGQKVHTQDLIADYVEITSTKDVATETALETE